MDGAQIRAAVKEFNRMRREKDSDAESVVVRSLREGDAVVRLEYEDEVVEMTYPRSADSIWFCTGPNWLSADLNSSILVGLLSFQQILTAMCSKIDKKLQVSMGASGSSEIDDSIGLSQSAAGLEASGLFDGNLDHNYALTPDDLMELKQQVAEAQNVLGEGKVMLVPELGSVKLVLDIFAMMDPLIAKKLGLFEDQNVFISLSYEKSARPLVSCTQHQAPGFGVKNHLKSIIDFFFECWDDDREKLKKVGRPPEGMVKQAESVAEKIGENDNNALEDEGAAKKPKQSWWKSVSAVFRGGATDAPTGPEQVVVVRPASVSSMMDLGFDAIGCVRALVDSRNDVDSATMRLVSDAKRFTASKKNLACLKKLKELGHDEKIAAAALIKSDFDVDKAARLFEGDLSDIWKIPLSACVTKQPSRVAIGAKKKPEHAEAHPFNQDNFIFGLLTYLQERLSHYGSYCVSCQAPHSCYNPDGGVVCSEPLCVFQLEESPMEKLVGVHLCPFKDCCDLDLSTVGKEFMGMELDKVCTQYGLTSQQLLEMLLHRYLPTDQIKLMLENGLRNCQATKVESVLNPALCARFEHCWKAMRERRPDMKIQPMVAYHGTNEQALKGILDTGFLLNKLSKGSGDNGWYGCGIYFSKNIQTAMGYCRGRSMLVCSVLMGKIYKCPGRMDGAPCQTGYDSHEDPSGQEWVIWDEAAILPCYTFSW